MQERPWNELAPLVLHRLDELKTSLSEQDKKLETMSERLTSLHLKFATLSAKTTAWGLIAGSVGAAFIEKFLKF